MNSRFLLYFAIYFRQIKYNRALQQNIVRLRKFHFTVSPKILHLEPRCRVGVLFPDNVQKRADFFDDIVSILREQDEYDFVCK